jgi:hypothetical protein
VPAKKACGSRRPLGVADATCSSTTETSASSPIEMIVRTEERRSGRRRPSAGRPAAPGERRSGTRSSSRATRAPASSGRACRSRAGRSRPPAAAEQLRVARPQSASVSRITPASRASGESTSAATRSSRSRRMRPLLRGAASAAAARTTAAAARRARRSEAGVAQVHVRRVERVGLDRQRRRSRQPGQPVGEQPVRIGRGGGGAAHRGLVDEAQGQVRRRLRFRRSAAASRDVCSGSEAVIRANPPSRA